MPLQALQSESYLKPKGKPVATWRSGKERVTMNDSVYQVVTSKIISLLEQGTIPWQQPWRAGEQAPQNLISRKPYRGINLFLLNSLRYESPYFLTFNQAKQLGGFIKRGEKACPVIYWKLLEIKDNQTGEMEKIPLLRYYSVFNVTQCEGISSHIPTASEPKGEFSPIESAAKIVSGMPKRPEVRHGFNGAFYSPAEDYVGMPKVEQFKSAEEYYCVLFHELTHSTGHEKRLHRKGKNGLNGQWSNFGSESYSQEELCAEMGSAFLCAESGIVDRTINNSASYISSWLERLRKDSKLLIQASSQAQKAADWILGRCHVETLEESEPISQN